MVRSLGDRTFQLSGEHESLRRLPWATEADHEPQSLPLPPDPSPSGVLPGLRGHDPLERHAVLRVALRRAGGRRVEVLEVGWRRAQNARVPREA